MKVLIVSGIWPPDIGGPASHAPELASFLRARGHEVEVVTTAAQEPARQAYAIHWVDRALPIGVRHVRAATLVRTYAAPVDVVYTTGMLGRSAAGSLLAGTPFVAKLTADPAYERSRRRGFFVGSLEDFQRGGGGRRSYVLRNARDAALRRAAHVFCPSEYLRRLAIGWGLAPERVSVLPNPIPPVQCSPGRRELRERFGLNGATLAFAGRLTRQKALEVALEALARADGVSLVLAGEGEERAALERRVAELRIAQRVRFLGPQPRERVLELLQAADALLLSSAWENAPHAVVEALAVGTPVLATKAGGVAEVVEHERNGLLVEPGDSEALAEAVQRFFSDADLRERLRAGAAPSVAAYPPELVYGRLEEVLAAVSGVSGRT